MNIAKKMLLTLIAVIASVAAMAQPTDPVKWSASVEDLGDDTYRLVFEAVPEMGWHLYDLGPYEGGPMATTFTFEDVNGLCYSREVRAGGEICWCYYRRYGGLDGLQ